MIRNGRWIVLTALVLVLLVATLLVSRAYPTRHDAKTTPGGASLGLARAPSTIAGTTSRMPPRRVVNVVAEGADPSGSHDATAAIARALTLAQSHPGGEVYFPAGRYILDDPSRRQVDFLINRPIHIVGAGPGRTVIVNELGALNSAAPVSTTIFEIVTDPNTHSGGGDGTTISGMTLDSASYDAGTSIMDFANHTTLSDLVVRAPRSTNSFNPNAFGIRVIAVCNPSDRSTVSRIGNVVVDVVITGNGAQGQTELDLSCQQRSTVDDVTIDGNGVDVFYCSHDTLENLTLTGSPTAPGHSQSYTWVVTGSYDITISDVHTVGSGGVIAPDVTDVTRGLRVIDETMNGVGAYLSVGDSERTVIKDSHLQGIRLVPTRSIVGFDLIKSSDTGVRCSNGKVIKDLVGLRCP